MGLQSEIKRLTLECDVVVCTYENDNLCKESDLINRNTYNAAIIGAASESDMNFLESIEIPFPIVLYDRYSGKYFSVCNDDEATAYKAA